MSPEERERELIIKAKAGDKEAFRLLLEDHKVRIANLARERMYTYHIPTYLQEDMFDDLKQEGAIKLQQIILDKFDGDRGFRLWTYAKRGVGWHMNDIIKQQYKHWFREVSIDKFSEEDQPPKTFIDEQNPTADDIVNRLAAPEKVQEIMQTILRMFLSKHRSNSAELDRQLVVVLVLFYMKRLSARQIAQILSTPLISSSRVNWPAIHRRYSLPPEIPQDWASVCKLFETTTSPNLGSNSVALKRLEWRISQLLSRYTPKLKQALNKDLFDRD